MTAKRRKRDGAQFKFKVALDAAKGTKTINESASEHSLHPNQFSQWKRQLLEAGPLVFSSSAAREQRQQEASQAELFEQIGRLKMELEWLKKKLLDPVEVKRMMIEGSHAAISIRRQCDLIGLNRSTLYYHSADESPLNLELMRLLDEQYTKTPFYGWPRMAAHLHRLGYEVNHKRVQRLMQQMGLQALYPKPRTTVPGKEHKIYPYLLRDVEICRPNHVWAADITYIRMHQGFMYLVAVMDWFSRYVIAWELSNTLDGLFCLQALDRALEQGQPEIFNTDQGIQFTAVAFTVTLQSAGIRISMDGRGRALDNIFVERLWRSVKYEDIYLRDYETVPALHQGLKTYFTFYNSERPHQSLGYLTPAEVHYAH